MDSTTASSGLESGLPFPMKASFLTVKSGAYNFCPRKISSSQSCPDILELPGTSSDASTHPEESRRGEHAPPKSNPVHRQLSDTAGIHQCHSARLRDTLKSWRSSDAIAEFASDYVPSDPQLQEVQKKRNKQWWRKIRPAMVDKENGSVTETKGRPGAIGKRWKQASILSKTHSVEVQDKDAMENGDVNGMGGRNHWSQQPNGGPPEHNPFYTNIDFVPEIKLRNSKKSIPLVSDLVSYDKQSERDRSHYCPTW